MSASEKIIKKDGKNTVPDVQHLAVLAGGGDMPRHVIEACERQGIDVFVVAFQDQAHKSIVHGREHMWSTPGKAGLIIKTLKNHGIRDLVMIGSMRRPSLSEIKPDLKTAAFLAKLSTKSLGDDGFLGAVRSFLEGEGLRVHGAHKFAQDLIAPEGVLTKAKPKKVDWIDINKGFEISQAVGRLDVGQSVVVQEGLVLAVEAVEGTDRMIERCSDLKRKGRGGVLVKTCKPQQDRNLDLPTIGPDTIRMAAEAGLAGVAVHAHNSLILDRDLVIELANDYKIFVIGVGPDQV